jgi:hypothetical protein
MRALCGAIMSAGAFVGLGLTAIGVGMRYQVVLDDQGHHTALQWYKLDPALLVIIILLVLAALTGIGVAFLGLMYHHHRRHHEMLAHTHGNAGTAPASPQVPA